MCYAAGGDTWTEKPGMRGEASGREREGLYYPSPGCGSQSHRQLCRPSNHGGDVLLRVSSRVSRERRSYLQLGSSQPSRYEEVQGKSRSAACLCFSLSRCGRCHHWQPLPTLVSGFSGFPTFAEDQHLSGICQLPGRGWDR